MSHLKAFNMLLDLKNVTRLYGTVIGVNDLTLDLPPGAHGLLGPNGAGKTTLLNLITGQLSPTLGSVRVLGESPRLSSRLRQRVGYLPGSEGMYPNVSAIEWVTYLTRLQGYHAKKAGELARNALDRVGIAEHMHRNISTYSRGMRQRARLAQAIAHEPEFLILDEPFSGLDPIARHAMTVFLQDWIAHGHSLLLASHVLHEIESLTRSFLLLCGGRLLASGSADDIHDLLADIPTEVMLRSQDAKRLAAELIGEGLVESARIIEDGLLKVTTSSSLDLSHYLNRVSGEGRHLIHELRTADDSLQDVFNSLMKIHRGTA
ncbi:MAG: ABC transporter ATP-binding protein [bacterium]|nr:ABC transporter ATP-binding protein [bacterium]